MPSPYYTGPVSDHFDDSGYGDGRYFRTAAERLGPFKLAILPIGAYEPRWFMRDHHMNPAEAVQALIDCGAERALAHHHGTFRLTDEAIDAPVLALRQALNAAGIAPARFAALQPRPGMAKRSIMAPGRAKDYLCQTGSRGHGYLRSL